jgi:hypothetical protein
MDSHIRDVKKEVERFIKAKTIDDYSIELGTSPRINIKVGDRWRVVRFAATPRTEFQNNYVRQAINRLVTDSKAHDAHPTKRNGVEGFGSEGPLRPARSAHPAHRHRAGRYGHPHGQHAG